MATLEQLKQHVRVTPEEFDFDDELTLLLEAARDHFTSIDVDLSEPIAPALSHALLLLAGYWFTYGDSSPGEALKPIPYGVTRLIAPYKGVSL
jgi:hypothetical protein